MERPVHQFIYTKIGFHLFAILIILSFLSACASSNVTRDVTANIDKGVENAKNFETDGSIADAYQNTSQKLKGAVMGGAAGAVVGALSSTVGVFPGTAIGAIFGASYGMYIDSNMTLDDELVNRGVVTVVLGDQILIVIPSFRIFNYASATINPQAYSTLQLVTQYINNYTKMAVNITGYTDDTGTSNIDFELSKQQAEQVSRFLQESGLKSRLVYAIGCGGTRLVRHQGSGWESENYRIEITFEKLPV